MLRASSYRMRLSCLTKTALSSRKTWQQSIQFQKIQQSRLFSSTSSSVLSTYFRKFAFYRFAEAALKRWWVRRLIRAIQVAGLSFAIYQAGYSAGLTAYADNPESAEAALLSMILNRGSLEPAVEQRRERRGQDGSSGNEGGGAAVVHARGSPEYRRVAKVARRILTAARNHCQEELDKAEKELQREELKLQLFLSPLPASAVDEMTVASEKRLTPSSNVYSEILRVRASVGELREIVQVRKDACHKLEGNWQFMVVTDARESVNAFVSGVLPRRIFVYTGLLKHVNPTEDELALILGHELSHVILGHTNSAGSTSALLLGAQLVVMSLVDPSGLLTLIFDAFLLQKLRQVINATYSRAHEEEADALGLRIAYSACYDTTKAVKVFKKLADLAKSRSLSALLLRLPPSSSAESDKVGEASVLATTEAAGGAGAARGTGQNIGVNTIHGGAITQTSSSSSHKDTGGGGSSIADSDQKSVERSQNEKENFNEMGKEREKEMPQLTHARTKWTDTHPNSLDRYENLLQMNRMFLAEMRKEAEEEKEREAARQNNGVLLHLGRRFLLWGSAGNPREYGGKKSNYHEKCSAYRQALAAVGLG